MLGHTVGKSGQKGTDLRVNTVYICLRSFPSQIYIQRRTIQHNIIKFIKKNGLRISRVPALHLLYSIKTSFNFLLGILIYNWPPSHDAFRGLSFSVHWNHKEVLAVANSVDE